MSRADPRRIAAVVRPEGSVTAVESVDRGRRKRTAVVRFADADPVVVQRSTDRRAVRTEAAVMRTLADTLVPMPRVLATGESADEAWFATPFVDGRNLHEAFPALDPARRRRVVAAFGRYLATAHETLRFDRPGPVVVVESRLAVAPTDGGDAAGPGLPERDPERGVASPERPRATNGSEAGTSPASSPAPQSPESHLSGYGRTHVARLPAEFDDLRPRLLGALSEAPATTDPRLFPWDLRPGNALVADSEVAAVLDWEAALAADPALAVATAEYLAADWYPVEPAPDLRAAFREDYRSVRPVPAVETAHRVAAVASSAVDSAGAVTEPGSPRVDRGRAVAFHQGALERALGRGPE